MSEHTLAFAQGILTERFGSGEDIIAMATVQDGKPQVRNVTAYFKGDSFYVLTFDRSGKMGQLQADNAVALSGRWFAGHGAALDLGPAFEGDNDELAQPLKKGFGQWASDSHSGSGQQVRLLRLKLSDTSFYCHGTKYTVEFD